MGGVISGAVTEVSSCTFTDKPSGAPIGPSSEKPSPFLLAETEAFTCSEESACRYVTSINFQTRPMKIKQMFWNDQWVRKNYSLQA